MANTKKQHYVPRCYLKNFTDKDERIHVFDKQKLEIRPSRIVDVAMENYFYDLKIDELINKGTKPEVDKFKHDILSCTEYESWDEAVLQLNKLIEKDFYSSIEGDYSAWLQTFIHKYSSSNNSPEGYSELSEKERKKASFFCTIQLMRTKQFRKQNSYLWKQVLQFLSNHLSPKDDAAAKDSDIEINDELRKMMHISALIDPEYIAQIADILFNHFWIIYKNETDVPFYTSDNPISIIPPNRNWGSDSYGIGSADVEIVFPITPDLLIAIYGRKKINPKYSSGTCIVTKDVKLVDYMNIAQIFNSERCVYSKTKTFEINGTYLETVTELKTLGNIK